MCKGAGWLVMRDLPVGHPDWCKLMPCDCGMVRAKRVQRYDLAFGFESPLTEIEWPDIRPIPQQQAAVSDVRRYIEHPHGWLYLVGPFGNGKTTLAALAVNQLRRAGYEAVFGSVPLVLQYLRDCLRERGGLEPAEELDYIKRVPVLALDDLGAERLTEWAAEQLYEVLNWRYVKRRPTIITSNYAPDELLDKRLASRIADVGLTQVIDCGEGDIRRMAR